MLFHRVIGKVGVLVSILSTPVTWAGGDFQKGFDCYEAKQYQCVLDEWRPIAERGHAGAQYNLGVMYDNGQGVKQNYTEAVKWYRLAAEQGDSSAQYNLGVMYANGQGVKQDYAEALKWYRLAAEQGYASAQYNLGVMYDNGRGVKQDYAEAVKWLRLAAEQGHAMAQSNLGVMYDNGQGVKQDYAEAVKWFRLAAEQGNAGAQYNLGVMYDNGRGLKRDYAEAVKWYRPAVGQGYADAMVNLGRMYKNGHGVEKDAYYALYLSVKAAKLGNDVGINNVAIYKRDLVPAFIKSSSANIRAKGSKVAEIIKTAKQDTPIYALYDHGEWVESFIDDGSYTIGWIAKELLADKKVGMRQSSAASGPYPSAPAAQAGYTTCRTQCYNGDCYRTYSDGRKVHFRARMNFNPISNQFEYDSGGC